MKIRCLAIDDEPVALEKLKNYICRIPYLEFAGACEGAHEAMQVMADDKIDAVFVDINMPDVNGLEFIRALPDPPMVVFTTAYSEYAVDSYKVRAVDYLLKPYGFEDFQRAAGNLQKHWNFAHADEKCPADDAREDRDFLYLKVDYRYVRVSLEDIIYIEGMNEYLKVHLVKGDPLLTHTTFRLMNDSLPSHFLQVHRSYVVNMHHVKEVERTVVMLSDGTRISVSDSNRETFMRYLTDHSVRKLNS